MALAEDISEHRLGLTMLHSAWFLVVKFMQIYIEKEQAGQLKYEMYCLRRKKTLGTVMKLSPVLKEIKKKFIEKSDPKGNKGSGELRPRPHPAKLPTSEKELKA